jgi:hypothetical protein
MSVEMFSLVFDVWREVRKEFREELRRKGFNRIRLPSLAVLYDVNGAIAYYHVKTNTVVVSMRKIKEIAEKWKYDIRCVVKSVLWHELTHFYYSKVQKAFKDYDSEEKEVEIWEFTALSMCLCFLGVPHVPHPCLAC